MLIETLVILVIIGVALYLVETYIPMSPPIKTIVRVIAVLCLVIFLLNTFGITNFQLPR